MSLTFEVLNATADDWESLEQIHPAANKYWREVDATLVAEEMIRLVASGLLEVMPKAPPSVAAVVEQPIEYWFRMTQAGREQWQKVAKGFGSCPTERPQE